MCDVKIIGGINTEDEAGQDDKIIAVLSNKTDSTSKDIENISDIGENILKNIRYFLEHYKDNENNKFINVKEFYNKSRAIDIINQYSL